MKHLIAFRIVATGLGFWLITLFMIVAVSEAQSGEATLCVKSGAAAAKKGKGSYLSRAGCRKGFSPFRLSVAEIVNGTVPITSGPKGDPGPKGDTGATGPSGVLDITECVQAQSIEPIVNDAAGAVDTTVYCPDPLAQYVQHSEFTTSPVTSGDTFFSDPRITGQVLQFADAQGLPYPYPIGVRFRFNHFGAEGFANRYSVEPRIFCCAIAPR